jgi:hypothetical protein
MVSQYIVLINHFFMLFCSLVHVPKQVTLAIIKPDAVKAGLVDDIIKKVS